MNKTTVLEYIAKLATWIFSQGDSPVVSVAIPLDTPAPQPEEAEPVYKVSKAELLMGRDKQYALEYTQQISDNLDQLLVPVNKIRDAYGNPMSVNSGWRPPEVNGRTLGAAPQSKHLQGLAVDIADPNGEVWAWVLRNLELMDDLNIFMEDKRYTPTWVHFQLGAPKSGKRIFVPSSSRAPAPNAWDGNYDKKFDT